jgi:mono/diheme cytochrome c family protein
MRILLAVLATLLVAAVAGLAYLYSGAYNVAATAGHTPFGSSLLHTAMHQSVKAHADGIAVPELSSVELLREGAHHYDEMCAQCHLKPGLDTTELHRGLTPTPPNFAAGEGLDHWQPAELFWIVKHGIKMTGMPAWGPSHSDQELWGIVGFVQKLPGLSVQEYRQWVPEQGTAGGHGHGGSEGAQEGGHSQESGASQKTQGQRQGHSHQGDGHDH